MSATARSARYSVDNPERNSPPVEAPASQGAGRYDPRPKLAQLGSTGERWSRDRLMALNLAPTRPDGSPDVAWARAWHDADPFTRRAMIIARELD